MQKYYIGIEIRYLALSIGNAPIHTNYKHDKIMMVPNSQGWCLTQWLHRRNWDWYLNVKHINCNWMYSLCVPYQVMAEANALLSHSDYIRIIVFWPKWLLVYWYLKVTIETALIYNNHYRATVLEPSSKQVDTICFVSCLKCMVLYKGGWKLRPYHGKIWLYKKGHCITIALGFNRKWLEAFIAML